MIAVVRPGTVHVPTKAHLRSEKYEPGESYIDPTLEPLGLDLPSDANRDSRITINDLVASVRKLSEQGPDSAEPVVRRREFVDLRHLENLARNFSPIPPLDGEGSPHQDFSARQMEQVLSSLRSAGDAVATEKLVDMISCCDVRVHGTSLETELRTTPQDPTELDSSQKAALLLRNLALFAVLIRAETATNPIERIAAARVAASQIHLDEAQEVLWRVFSTDPEPAVLHAVAEQIHSVVAIKDPKVREFAVELFEAGQKHLNELKGRLGEFTQETDPSRFRYHFRCWEASTALLTTKGRDDDGSGMGGFA